MLEVALVLIFGPSWSTDMLDPTPVNFEILSVITK
jgi:hypothetical protein